MVDRSDADLAPRVAWWWFAAPIVVSAALRDFWAPDEPRYAMLARSIYESREFLVLYRCGELYPDKPPFVYWLAGLLGWLSGWSEFAMRLVPLASMLGVAWFTEKFARRFLGELEARWAPLLFLGFVLVFVNSGWLGLDATLTLGCVGALYFASAPATSEREASRQVVLAGVCAGVAMFTKGPVALINIGLPLIAWRVVKGRSNGPSASRSSIAIATALTVLPVLTWAVLASLREPALWRPLFFGQHIERAAKGTAHKGPLWEHALNLPLFLLPWTVPVVFGIVDGYRAWRARRRKEAHSEGLVLAWWWFAVLFVFFSIIPAKREVYLLPAYPALALLGAQRLSNALRRGRIGLASALVPIGMLALLGALIVGAPWLADQLVQRSPKLAADLAPLDGVRSAHPELPWRLLAAAAPLLVGSVLAFVAHRRGRFAAWANGVAITWAVGLVTTLVLLAPLVDPLKSDRSLAKFVSSLPQHPSEIACYGASPDGVRFYGGGPCVQVATAGLKNGEFEARLAREGEQFLALVEDDDFRKLTPAQLSLCKVLATIRVGSSDVYVLGSTEPASTPSNSPARER